MNTGCEDCKKASVLGMTEPLVKVAEADGPVFLYECKLCSALWKENLRFSEIISIKYAKKIFNYKIK